MALTQCGGVLEDGTLDILLVGVSLIKLFIEDERFLGVKIWSSVIRSLKSQGPKATRFEIMRALNSYFSSCLQLISNIFASACYIGWIKIWINNHDFFIHLRESEKRRVNKYNFFVKDCKEEETVDPGLCRAVPRPQLLPRGLCRAVPRPQLLPWAARLLGD